MKLAKKFLFVFHAHLKNFLHCLENLLYCRCLKNKEIIATGGLQKFSYKKKRVIFGSAKNFAIFVFGMGKKFRHCSKYLPLVEAGVQHTLYNNTTCITGTSLNRTHNCKSVEPSKFLKIRPIRLLKIYYEFLNFHSINFGVLDSTLLRV